VSSLRPPDGLKEQAQCTTVFDTPLIAPQPAALQEKIQSPTVLDKPLIAPQEFESQGWLARVGVLSKRHPLLVWLGGSVSIFVLSASTAAFSKSRHHLPASPVSHAGSMVSREPALTTSLDVGAASATTIAKSAPQASAEMRPVTPSHTSDKTILIVPVVPSPSVTGQSVRKGQPNDPDLIAAVGELVRGQYNDAQHAYSALAARSPNDAALAAVARLLVKETAPSCANAVTNSHISCPRVTQ
jgi:hypothetical protein